jgi:hypothetical protein
MCHRFILFILLTSSSQASIPSSTIDSDANEIFTLNKVFTTNSPAVFHRSQSLLCEMINSCCPSIKPHLSEYVDGAVTGNNKTIVTACIGNKHHQSFFNTCPMARKLVNVADDKNFQKYTNLITTALSGAQNHSIRIQRPCSFDETYATLCDWTQVNHIESCERKTLAYVAQHNADEDYRTFVRETKKNMRLVIDAIKRAFPNENTIKPTTSSTTVKPITSGTTKCVERTVWIIVTLLALVLLVFSCHN